MSEEVHVALIQADLKWENPEQNLEMFSAAISGLKSSADLIVLPEMFTTGFSMNTKLAEQMNGKSMQWMKQMAAERNCVVAGSLMIEENERFFNRLIWMQPDGTFSQYDKRHLFSISDEPLHFTRGEHLVITEVNGWKFLPLICYDLRFPVWSRNLVNYDALVYVANWPQKRNLAWKTLLRARAIENQSYVIGVNRVGVDGNGFAHSGDSAAINFLGETIFENSGEEIAKTVTLHRGELEAFRKRFPFLNDRDEFEIKW